MRGIHRDLLLCAASLAVVLMAGCADDGTEAMEDELEEDSGSSVAEDASLDARSDGKQDAAASKPDAASRDAAEPEPELDAALMDASMEDSGLPGTSDAGQDGGLLDAGADAGKDAGPLDAGADAGKDAGPSDAGSDAGKDASTPDASTPDASTPDASTPDASIPANTFSSVYLILSGQCTGCHGSSGGLNMGNKQRAYDELTGGPMGPAMGVAEGPACGSTGKRRVVPFDAASSLIIEKLSGAPACGNAMPPGDMLSTAAINEIRAWITAGALNN